MARSREFLLPVAHNYFTVKIYISSATPDCFRSDWNR